MGGTRDRSIARRRALLVAAPLAWAVLVGGVLPGVAQADVGDPVPPSRTVSSLAKIVYRAALHDGPSDSSTVTGTVQPKTQWGGQTQLLVKDSERTVGELWLDVRLAGRPNGNHAWIKADSAQLSTTPWRIELRRSTKTLVLFKAGRSQRSFKVVVGAAETPTPAGHFAILDKLQLREADADNFLGSWVLPITAYSDVLQTFDGGPGQIALHGRGGASLKQPVGTAASHGCVRIENRNIARLAAAVPTGTPVDVI